MRGLEGANCADLPGFVIDKYFDCDANLERLRAMVGKAICGNCVVREACREQAMIASPQPSRGIIGGVTAKEIVRARAWRSFELGLRDKPPRDSRPTWLPRPDATETVEQARLEADPDEPN